MMFWRPDASPESLHLFLSWLKSEGMTLKVANQDLSSALLQFRAANKERLFAIAHQILADKPKLPTPSSQTIVVKKIASVQPKPIHKNSAVVGTAVATPVLSTLTFFYHTLPAPISTVIIGIVALILSVIEHQNYHNIIKEVEKD